MKATTCHGCGQTTVYLVVKFCTACLREMTASMKGER